MIAIPDKFNKNHKNIKNLGLEKTGQFIIDQILNRTDKKDLSNSNVLDVGCGVRLTATIVNNQIPLKSYNGLDLDCDLISFLQENVKDNRFSFNCVDYQNDMYNKFGKPLSDVESFPVNLDHFDLILMFSVITHQDPNSAQSLFRICRKHVKNNGKLVFSAFLDNKITDFFDKHPNKPLLEAFYNQTYIEELLSKEGWKVDAVYPPDKQKITQHFFVCSPKL